MQLLKSQYTVYDSLHPSNTIFRLQHRLGGKLLGPGDPSCCLCKGTGICFDFRCSCQNGYITALMKYAEDNHLSLELYYSAVKEPDPKFDLELLDGQAMKDK